MKQGFQERAATPSIPWIRLVHFQSQRQRKFDRVTTVLLKKRSIVF